MVADTKLAERIIRENPAFITANDHGPVEVIAQQVIDRLYGEVIMLQMRTSRKKAGDQMKHRIDEYGIQPTQH